MVYSAKYSDGESTTVPKIVAQAVITTELIKTHFGTYSKNPDTTKTQLTITKFNLKNLQQL